MKEKEDQLMEIKKPEFEKLKFNYRIDPEDIHNCSMHFPNTCAIRMSEALVRTNTNFLDIFKASELNKCPHGYIRGAQDLAAILEKPNGLGRHDLGWENPNDVVPNNIIGKKGIICYMDIPEYNGQGHIDLWNGDAPVGASYWNCRRVWFWKLS